MESNRELSRSNIQKADLTVKNITDDGGYLQAERAQAFIDLTIKESKLLDLMTPMTLKSHTKEVDRIGFTDRITRRGQEARSLTEAGRSKPTTSKLEIKTVTVKFQVNLDEDVIEDNIEGDGLVDHINALIAKRFKLDCEELSIKGDVDSTDTFLSLQDGFIKKATSHPVDDGVGVVAMTHFAHLMNALPDEYQGDLSQLRFLMAPKLERKQRDLFGARLTVGGDSALTSKAPIPMYGVDPLTIPIFPTTLGDSGAESVILLLDPKNMLYAVWRQVKIKMQEDIEAGVIKIVGRARVGFEYFLEDAVAKAIKVKYA
jgi:hypothetical protein